MNKQLRFAWAIGLALISTTTFSQRYLTPQFSGVTEAKNVVYNTNIAVNIIPPNTPPLVSQNLVCDIYQPDGDTATARPLVIVLHTGSFLPAFINQQVTGNKEDSAVVEVCRRFARMGYVAVAMNYRIGWNPAIQNSDTATAQLLQATYRGLQDAKNCVRFFRENAADYALDTTRTIIGGFGTGGYIALAYAAVDKQEELELEKFLYSQDPYPPMVNSAIFGDWNGYGGIPQVNISGNPNYGSSVSAIFHVGGAMGDISWLEGNEVPILSIHCVLDPYAPYKFGNVIVPTTGVTVINNAAGGGAVQDSATALGINDIIANRDYTDAISVRAAAINGGNEGLYPLILPERTPSFANEGSPWEWWDSTIVKNINFPAPGAGLLAHNNSMYNNPDMSKTKAMAYIDTIQGFLAPRLVCAMDLPGCPSVKSSVAKVQTEKINVFPNPSNGNFKVSLNSAKEITRVEMYNVNGKLINNQLVNSAQAEVNVNGISAGVYILKIHTAGSVGTTRIVVE